IVGGQSVLVVEELELTVDDHRNRRTPREAAVRRSADEQAVVRPCVVESQAERVDTVRRSEVDPRVGDALKLAAGEDRDALERDVRPRLPAVEARAENEVPR